MSRLLPHLVKAEKLSEISLDQLIKKAENFGNVRIWSDRETKPPNCYRCTIEFECVPGTVLEAKSEFNRPISEAVLEATKRAEIIASRFKKD